MNAPDLAHASNQPPSQEEEVQAPQGAWQRLTHDLQRRPRFYVVLGLLCAAFLAGGWIFTTTSRRAADMALANFNQQVGKAEAESDGIIRVTRMEGLREQAHGKPYEPIYLLRLARAAQYAAQNAATQEQKLRFYKKAVAVLTDIKTRFSKNPLVLLPWKPNIPGTVRNPSVVQGLLAFCQDQLDFLKQHPYRKEGTLDQKVKATITLKSPTGKVSSVVIRFYSALVPLHVAVVLRLAREGWFDNTQVMGVEREKLGNPNQGGVDQRTAIHLGSGMTKAAPKNDKLWGDLNKDRVGFTIPAEASPLKPDRKRVALEWYQNVQGSSPVRLVIYTKKPKYAQFIRRIVIGEVVEGEQILDDIASEKTKEKEAVSIGFLKLEHLQKPYQVMNVKVEGEASTKPSLAVNSKPRLPEPPKVEGQKSTQKNPPKNPAPKKGLDQKQAPKKKSSGAQKKKP